MNWKIGTKLVCIDDNWGNPFFTGIAKKDNVYTFDGMKNSDTIFLSEDHTELGRDRAGYAIWRFRPLLGESAVSELTKFVEVVETSDCPIKSPQIAEPCGS